MRADGKWNVRRHGRILAGLANAGLLVALASPAFAYSEVQSLYPASFCQVDTNWHANNNRVGAGQFFGVPAGSQFDDNRVSFFCPIFRTQPTFESVVLLITFDYSLGSSASCTLNANPNNDDTVYGARNLPGPATVNSPDDLWLGISEISADTDMVALPADPWSSFSAQPKTDTWASLMLECSGDAPVLGYYVFEYTVL